MPPIEKKKGSEIFRPYARIISVLGDQLISDKWVGVIELVKNSYDADAEDVAVRFLNFEAPTKENPKTIIIEDNGVGMDLAIIQNDWMKPATPNKLNRKKEGKKDRKKRFTGKGRVMQGDKGVGRFAIYKLGNFVELFTKTMQTEEIQLTLNFHPYADDEFKESDHKDKFLDEITNEWQINDEPVQITNRKHQGTKLIIKDLRNEWKQEDLEKLLKAFHRMMPPVIPGAETVIRKDFKVTVYWNEIEIKPSFKTFEEIISLAPFYFEGIIENDGSIDFTYKYGKRKISKTFNLLTDEEKIVQYNLWSLKFFREVFLKLVDKNKKASKDNLEPKHLPGSGRFIFFFYAFDWKNPIEGLKEDEKKFLQENSVYLYRDNVRVFPYGERGVDWLMLSKLRAEDRAGHYFSYNDLIGFIFITQNDNPKLRDAADREGLMNIDGAYDDFVAQVQAALKIMKDEVEIDKTKNELRKQKALTSVSSNYQASYEALQSKLSALNDKELLDKTTRFFKATNNLVTKVKEDLKITQELAGTGMAVEKATHDTMSLIKKLRTNTEDIVEKMEKKKITPGEIKVFLEEMQESLEFLYQELQVLQPLFRVARKVTKDVSVRNVSDRVIRYFRKELENRITVTWDPRKDFTVKTNTGLVLQVLLNLMDNSVYWLDQTSKKIKEIQIQIDPDNRSIIFADNGPGIDEEIAEIVFTEFFSRKEDGRGLGLYIVKELLDRINAEISVITDNNLKILPGANFIIQFDNE